MVRIQLSPAVSQANFYIAPLARPDLDAGRAPLMVCELGDRAELDEYFRTEPYCVNGTYQHIEIYDSTRSPQQGKEGRQ